MKKKKKKTQESIPNTERGETYFHMWEQLQACHEEHEFDETRRELNKLWNQMDKEDRKCFHRLTDHK